MHRFSLTVGLPIPQMAILICRMFHIDRTRSGKQKISLPIICISGREQVLEM